MTNEEGAAAGTWYRFRNAPGEAETFQIVKLWEDQNGKRQTLYNDLYRYTLEVSTEDREGVLRDWSTALSRGFEATMLEVQELWAEYPEHYQPEFLGRGTPNPFPSVAEFEPEDQPLQDELEWEDERDDFNIEL